MTGEVAAHARRAGAWIVIAFGLAIPISTAASSVLLALLVVAWLIAAPGSLREAAGLIRTTPPIAAAVLLFAALLAGCLYGEGTTGESLSRLSKYLELALVPALAWGAANPQTRKRALVCFAIAVVLSLYVSYSAAADLPGLRNPVYPIGFKASITHNVFVSLGAFLFLLVARETSDLRWRAGLIALAALCAHNVIFIVIGRTGYVVLAALLAYFVATTLRGWRGPVLGIVVCSAVFPAAYLASPTFRDRVDEIGSSFKAAKPPSIGERSVAMRVDFYRTTLQIIAEHPLTGVGTGGFTRAYAEKVKGTDAPATTNPHNDYLLMAAMLGIPGPALIVALYVTLWLSARRLGSPLYRDLARGLVLTMAIAGLFNSMLHDHAEGLLFAWLTALLYATYRASPRPAAIAPAAR